MHSKGIYAIAALAALAWSGAVRAEAPTLKFGTTAPPGTHIAKWFDAWTEEVNKVNPDAVKVKVFHNTLGNTRTILDSIRNKVADFGWFNPGYFAGQFERFYVTTVPGLSPVAEFGSVAVLHLHEKGMFADEFKRTTPEGSADYKSLLQEMLQSKQLSGPAYSLLRSEGMPHERTFYVEAAWETGRAEGNGSSIKSAEMMAASEALRSLQIEKSESAKRKV